MIDCTAAFSFLDVAMVRVLVKCQFLYRKSNEKDLLDIDTSDIVEQRSTVSSLLFCDCSPLILYDVIDECCSRRTDPITRTHYGRGQ
jgi:hypothetical protein